MNKIKEVANDHGIIIYFHTDWCGYCRQSKPIWDLASKRLDSHVKWLSFNCSKRSSFPFMKKKYNIKAYPTVIGLTPSNQLGKRKVLPFEKELTTSNLQIFAATIDKSVCERRENMQEKLSQLDV